MRFPELGIYLLPGHSDRPADLLDEVRAAEALGLGSAWISERFDVKEVGALAGAAAAVTKEIWIGSGVTNIDTRHPLLLASLATTVSRLSDGRFALGVGRGIAVRSAMLGLPPVSNAQLRDSAALMRRLWKGERVVGHDSSLGQVPVSPPGELDERVDPAADDRVRPEEPRVRGQRLRRRDPPHLPLRRRGEARGRARARRRRARGARSRRR